MRIIQVGTGTQPIGHNSKTAVEIAINNLSIELKNLGNDVEIIDIQGDSIKRDKKLKYHFISLPDFLYKKSPKPGSPLHMIKKFIFSIKCISLLSRLNKNKDIDIIHIQNQYPGFFILSFLRRFMDKTRFVYTSHTPFWTLPENEFSKGGYFIKTLMERVCLNRADKVIAVGNYQREQILEKTHLDSRKIMAIHNGVELNIFHPGKARLNLKKKPGEIIILSVARVSKVKNQLAIVRAIPHIIKYEKNIRFIFAGQLEDVEYVAEINDFVKKNNLEQYVSFIGPISNDILPEYYRSADIFVSASKSEGLPLTVIEAMASGCPLVLSGIGSHKEFSKDTLYFAPESSEELAKNLISLIRNKKKRELIAKLMAQTAKERFSWKITAKKNLQLYKELI